jgi:hypothetical protein
VWLDDTKHTLHLIGRVILIGCGALCIFSCKGADVILIGGGALVRILGDKKKNVRDL